MGMCEQCPKRDVIALLNSLGSNEEARRIENQGCPWWWSVEEKTESGAVRTRRDCGVTILPQFLTDFGSRIVQAMKTAQECHKAAVAAADSNFNLAAAIAWMGQCTLAAPLAPPKIVSGSEVDSVDIDQRSNLSDTADVS